MSSPSSHPPIPLPAPTAPEQAALDWFARCDRGLTADQEAAFQEWLAADARHAELFNELASTWDLLGRAPASLAAPSTGSNRGTSDLAPGNLVPRVGEQDAMNGRPSRRARALRRWALPLAAAAALVLGYIGYWRPAHYAGESVTEVGTQRTLRLPDGSVVTLNTDSVVAADFSPGVRRVRLERGEATFAVARNPDRPFVVEARGVAVRAVGTAFNVRLAASSVEVLVLEGRVQVADAQSGASLLPPEPAGLAAAEPLLTPGQRAIVALADPRPRAAAPSVAAVSNLPDEEMRRRTAWQEGRLDFEAAPLAEIVAEFNRYHRHKLVIADPALADQRFGGSFRPDDQAGFVRMLQENFQVRVERMEGVTVLRASP